MTAMNRFHCSYTITLFVCLSVRVLTLISFNRLTSNLAHRLFRSRSPSLVIFSFRGQTPWGQDRVKGHMLSYGQKFVIILYILIVGSKKINFCQRNSCNNMSIHVISCQYYNRSPIHLRVFFVS